MIQTFHVDVGLPVNALNAVAGKSFRLVYTRHAMLQAGLDRYGWVKPPKSITVDPATVFELTQECGALKKFGVRLTSGFLAERRDVDLILILILDGDCLVVKTLWLNERNDKHQTLRKDRYEKTSAQTPVALLDQRLQRVAGLSSSAAEATHEVKVRNTETL
jgi:hypothetical protein